MVGWHHPLNGHESEQTPGAGEGQGRLAGCSPQHHKESDMTERLHNSWLAAESLYLILFYFILFYFILFYFILFYFCCTMQLVGS